MSAIPDPILVTGASGCLGFPLAGRLAREGRTVVGLDLAPPPGPASFHAVRGDVCDPHLLHRLFREFGFRAVVHCGGISGQMVAPGDPYRNCHVNVVGTMHVLEAAREHKVERLIYSSSQAAYGDASTEPITEDTRFEPTTVYGATKAACDLLVRAYRVQHGLNATALRIGRVYGPGRRTDSIIATLLTAALAGGPLRLRASGGVRIQYVYDADIVCALYLALSAGTLPLPAYNVSGPGEFTDDDIAAMIRVLAPTADITFEAAAAGGPTRSETVVGAPLDYSAAQRDFGYEPQYDMARGLTAYADALRNPL